MRKMMVAAVEVNGEVGRLGCCEVVARKKVVLQRLRLGFCK